MKVKHELATHHHIWSDCSAIVNTYATTIKKQHLDR